VRLCGACIWEVGGSDLCCLDGFLGLGGLKRALTLCLALVTGTSQEGGEELQHHAGCVGEHSRAFVHDAVERVLWKEEVGLVGKSSFCAWQALVGLRSGFGDCNRGACGGASGDCDEG
jgi:hypothetical protein